MASFAFISGQNLRHKHQEQRSLVASASAGADTSFRADGVKWGSNVKWITVGLNEESCAAHDKARSHPR